MKTCIGRLAVPTIAKGSLYNKLLEQAGGLPNPECEVIECNTSGWKVIFKNGKEATIPKSHLLDFPPGTVFIFNN